MSRSLVPLFVLLVASSSPPAQQPPELPEAERIVRAAVERHPNSATGQVAGLADLVWSDEDIDPEVRELARERLIGYGQDAFQALKRKVHTLDREQIADLVNVSREAYALVNSERPPEYLPIMYDAVWFGDAEACLAAIPEIIRFRYTRPMLPLIDATYEFESLTPVVITTAAALKDEHARFWLGNLACEPRGAYQESAAAALASIGGKALTPLRDCMFSPDRATRESAARALSTSAGSAELTFLYDYLEQYPDDDPAVLQGVRDRAVLLERALEELDEELSGSDEPEI